MTVHLGGGVLRIGEGHEIVASDVKKHSLSLDEAQANALLHIWWWPAKRNFLYYMSNVAAKIM